jgi:TatD DNase family protein
MPDLIDNHCHLDFRQFDDDRDEVIERCRERLKAVINAGSEPEANQRALDLAREHPDFIYPCIGAHPTKIDAIGEDGLDRVQDHIEDEQDSIVAIGETGLDYHHERSEDGRKHQEDFFRPLLKQAEDLGLPVVVHSRDAEKRALEMLSSYDIPEVIMHCFNGNLEQVETAVDRGYWISVSTQVLYSSRVKEIATEAPADSILLETDAPFLYPGGERNEPWRIQESLDEIAEFRDADRDELGRRFTANTAAAYMQEF